MILILHISSVISLLSPNKLDEKKDFPDPEVPKNINP